MLVQTYFLYILAFNEKSIEYSRADTVDEDFVGIYAQSSVLFILESNAVEKSASVWGKLPFCPICQLLGETRSVC